MDNRHRVVFFGTTNQLSLSAFEALLGLGAVPEAVVVTTAAAASESLAALEQLSPAATETELPLLNRYHEPTLIHSAWAAGVPVFAMSNINHRLIGEWLAGRRVHAAFSVCFPNRIPSRLLAIPSSGFLNVHPSLLPHYRGPAPLFWLFQKDDQAHRGVTVHLMDEGLDTGPIVIQEPVAFEDGLAQAQIERQCGQVGGRLLLEAIASLEEGGRLRPQQGAGSYDPWPEATDYWLDARWPAQRAYNFMRATNGSGVSSRITLPGGDMWLEEALGVDALARQDAPAILHYPIVHLQFSPGVLTARLDPFREQAFFPTGSL